MSGTLGTSLQDSGAARVPSGVGPKCSSRNGIQHEDRWEPLCSSLPPPPRWPQDFTCTHCLSFPGTMTWASLAPK